MSFEDKKNYEPIISAGMQLNKFGSLGISPSL